MAVLDLDTRLFWALARATSEYDRFLEINEPDLAVGCFLKKSSSTMTKTTSTAGRKNGSKRTEVICGASLLIDTVCALL